MSLRKTLRGFCTLLLAFCLCNSWVEADSIEVTAKGNLIYHNVTTINNFGKDGINSIGVGWSTNLSSLVKVREPDPPVGETADSSSESSSGILPSISSTPIVGICQNEGVSQSWVDRVNQELAVVPSNLLDKFSNSGWRMYCTTKNLDRTYFGGQFGAVMGVTLYDEHLIYIEDRTDAVTESPVHEFGHYLDWSLGFISNKPEFVGIFNNEQGTFRRIYGVPSYFTYEELYAEAFWRYLTSNRNTFRSNCPQLADFIERTIAMAS